MFNQLFCKSNDTVTRVDKKINDFYKSLKEIYNYEEISEDRKSYLASVMEEYKKVLESGKDVTEYIKADDLAGLSDEDLKALCQGAIDANPKAVEDIKNGKDKAINVMFGYVMKNSRGKADVSKAEAIIREIIAAQ